MGLNIRLQERAIKKMRSVNSQVLVLIRENIKAFEATNGAIDDKITPDSNVKPTRK